MPEPDESEAQYSAVRIQAVSEYASGNIFCAKRAVNAILPRSLVLCAVCHNGEFGQGGAAELGTRFARLILKASIRSPATMRIKYI